MDTTPTPGEVIDALGGSSAVAALCDVSIPAVSQWRLAGIPKARLMFLKLARPEIFALSPPREGSGPTTTGE